MSGIVNEPRLLCTNGLGHRDVLSGRQEGLCSPALKYVVRIHGCAIGRKETAIQAEFKNAWRINNGLWMVAVFKEREINGGGSADEQAALFLRDPVAAAVLAHQDAVGTIARTEALTFHLFDEEIRTPPTYVTFLNQR